MLQEQLKKAHSEMQKRHVIKALEICTDVLNLSPGNTDARILLQACRKELQKTLDSTQTFL